MISKTTKILLISVAIAAVMTQEQPSNYANCVEDYKLEGENKNIGCQECKPAFAQKSTPVEGTDPQLTYFECKACGEKCEACEYDAANDQAGECQQCQEGHGQKADKKSDCAPCEKENCADCNLDAAQCATCKPTFGLDEASGDCKPCGENCAECEKPGECKKCQPGWTVKSGEKTCTQCPGNCATCDDNLKCLTCKPGAFFLDAAKGTCQPCKQGCAQCPDADTCDQCESGSFLMVEECVAQCPTGYATANGICVKCALNCQTCNDFETCAVCKTGFYPKDSGCEQCPLNCQSCGTTGRCEVCMAGSTLQADGTCGSTPWTSRWWVWALITLAAIGLLAACASMLDKGASAGTRQYAGYQQYDQGTSYAARSQYEMNASQGQF